MFNFRLASAHPERKPEPEPAVFSPAGTSNNKDIKYTIIAGISGAFIIVTLIGWSVERARKQPFDFRNEITRMREAGELGPNVNEPKNQSDGSRGNILNTCSKCMMP
jgi:hypothetical protein